MRKVISAVMKTFHHHLMLEFEDGSKQLVFQGQYEAHSPKVGDVWPPEGHEHVKEGVQNGSLVPSPKAASTAAKPYDIDAEIKRLGEPLSPDTPVILSERPSPEVQAELLESVSEPAVVEESK